MGLDMYLYRKTYVPPSDHFEVTVKRDGEVLSHIKPARIMYVVEEVAYWRKANAIHKWFVENVQGGDDDRREYCVSHDQLQAIVNLCKQVLSTVETVKGDVHAGWSMKPGQDEPERMTRPGKIIAQQSIPAASLPTQDGFFFGSTDYDEVYIADLNKTVTQLEPLLSEPGDFYYEACW